MIRIISFEDAELSMRHGSYSGRNGKKDGIQYNNDMWIIKYPKPMRCQQTNTNSYESSPLSEYIGSHIYQLLGIDAHETQLGVRHGKLVVGCKDFCQKSERLFEMKSIKNATNHELSELPEKELRDYDPTGECVNFNEILLHLHHNSLFKCVPGVSERFWDMVVVDILIDNGNRNSANWGLIQNENAGTLRLAPVYANGSAFCSKVSDEQLKSALSDSDIQVKNLDSLTAYHLNGKTLSAKEMLQLDHLGLQESILRNIPRIQSSMEAVSDFIQQIPEETETQLPVCNDVRKAYYILKTILLSSPESVKARIFRDFPASLPTYTGAAIAGADVAVANK